VFHRNWTPRDCSTLTSQLVTSKLSRQRANGVRSAVTDKNQACSRSALDPASPARAARSGDQLSGRGSTLTRWRPQQRPPTVQFNALSIARESEDAS
jgi:hypothetical protein